MKVRELILQLLNQPMDREVCVATGDSIQNVRSVPVQQAQQVQQANLGGYPTSLGGPEQQQSRRSSQRAGNDKIVVIR